MNEQTNERTNRERAREKEGEKEQIHRRTFEDKNSSSIRARNGENRQKNRQWLWLSPKQAVYFLLCNNNFCYFFVVIFPSEIYMFFFLSIFLARMTDSLLVWIFVDLTIFIVFISFFRCCLFLCLVIHVCLFFFFVSLLLIFQTGQLKLLRLLCVCVWPFLEYIFFLHFNIQYACTSTSTYVLEIGVKCV